MSTAMNNKCYNAWRRLVKRYGDKLPSEWLLDQRALFSDIGYPQAHSDFIWVTESEDAVKKENVRWVKQAERAELEKLRHQPK